MRILLVLLGSPLSFPAAGLPAQQVIDSGSIVRVTTTSALVVGRLTERFDSRAPTPLRYCPYPAAPCESTDAPSRLKSIPLDVARAVQVRSGTNAGGGGFLGAMIGLGLGMGWYHLTKGFCESDSCIDGGKQTAFAMTAIGFLIGTVRGSGTGKWGPAIDVHQP